MPDTSPSSAPTIARDPRRPFVVVTGLSGAGRATALHALDDMGYVAVDNVPLPLLGDLMRSTGGKPGEAAPPLAFGVDTRTFGFNARELVDRVRKLREHPGLAVRLLFLECDTEILRRRYTETRRPHPMAPDRPVADGISEERKQIGWMRDSADVTIDTSAISPNRFRKILTGHFALGPSVGVRVSVMSFSYRRGLPREADLVFDVRFLANPHYVDALQPLDGETPEVARFIERDPALSGFLASLDALIEPLLPSYEREGKSYLTIAVGCTGGKHRSVYVAKKLADALRASGRPIALVHRDLTRDVSGRSEQS